MTTSPDSTPTVSLATLPKQDLFSLFSNLQQKYYLDQEYDCQSAIEDKAWELSEDDPHWRGFRANKAWRGFVFLALKDGAEGGNCWGEEALEFYRGDTVEPYELRALLHSAGFPELTNSQWELLYKEMSEISFSFLEYYGNYKNYQGYTVSFEKLANWFTTHAAT